MENVSSTNNNISIRVGGEVGLTIASELDTFKELFNAGQIPLEDLQAFNKKHDFK